jgi:hypothetical protein
VHKQQNSKNSGKGYNKKNRDTLTIINALVYVYTQTKNGVKIHPFSGEKRLYLKCGSV